MKGSKYRLDSALVLLGAGIDSTTMLAFYVAQGVRVTTLTVDYGQQNRLETEVARRNSEKYGAEEHVTMKLRPALRSAKGMKEGGEVPGRNAMLVSVAAGVAVERRRDILAIAVQGSRARHKVMTVPDASPGFINDLGKIVSASTRGRVRLEAPFAAWPKDRVVHLAVALGVDLSDTITCFAPRPQPCGACKGCQARRQVIHRVRRHSHDRERDQQERPAPDLR